MRRLTGLLLLLLLVTRPAAAQDAFEQQRAVDLARMRDVDPIYLTFVEGRTTYRMGESIPLSVEYSPIGLFPIVDENCPPASLLVVLDRPDMTAPRTEAWDDPRDGRLCGGGSGIYGGRVVFGGVLGIDEVYDTPLFPMLARETLHLSAAVRFETPGRYRFYVRSRFDAPTLNGTPPRLSNILTIDIVARDAAWESSALTKAAADLASGDLKRRWNAFGALALLATDGAVDVAAQDSSDALTNVAPPAVNRPHAVRRMTELVDDVTRPMDWRFLWTLSSLDATMQSTSPVPPEAVEARLRVHSARRLRALAAHGALDSVLGAAMFHAVRGLGDRVMWQVPAAGFPAVADAVSRALLALPPPEQRVVLADSLGWRDFADASFLPMFKRIAQDRRPGGAQDVAWAMWHRLEPDAARAFALREIAAPGAVLGTSGLPGLGDRLRPSLDAPLVARLEAATTDAEFLRVASLIERFSTGRLRSRVARLFERAPRAAVCPQGPVLLAYFFRVDPAYAETQLDRVGRVLDTTRDRCAGDGLLPAVAKRRALPAVEAAALKRLRDPRPWVVVDAAEALAKEGGPASKGALLAALDAWHAAWAPRASMLQRDNLPFELDWAASLGPRLARALDEANAWRLTPDDIAHIASRLFSPRERRRFEANASVREDTLEIDVWPPRLPDEPPYFFLPGVTMARGVEALRNRLALWPAGTHWRIATRSGFGSAHIPGLHPTTLWLPGEETANHTRVRALMRPLGMTVSAP